MTSTSPAQPADKHVAPQADHGDPARSLIARSAEGRAWLFLAGLIICFEIWSRLAFGATVRAFFKRATGQSEAVKE